MATTTIASSAASRGGIRLFGQRLPLVEDLLALLLLLAALASILMLSYSRSPHVDIGIAGKYERPYLQDFHEPETLAGQTTFSYRWTKQDSTVLAPGLGRGMWATRITLSSPQPQGQPKPVTLEAGGQRYPLQLQATPRTYHLFMPSRGDMNVTIDAPLGQYDRDPRPLGVVFFGASFTPIAPAIVPPAWLSLHTVIALILAYLTLRLIGLRPRLALVASLPALLLLAWGIATNRAPVGLLMQRLSILAVAGLAGVFVVRWGWNRLVALGQLQPQPWLLPALLLAFYFGFWIKAGGLLYPYSHSIDVPWHMLRTREILGGRFFELYQPGAFSESVMPEKEWGVSRPVIPYSPFVHILATSFAIFPWSLETTANVFSVFFDTNRVVLIAALALAFGLTSRGALLAALLYAATPFTFLLHSWGNIPTTFGIWWTLCATTLLVLTFGRWRERRVFTLLVVVLLLTFLFYTVMAVFMALFLALLFAGLLLFGRGLSASSRQAGALLGAASLAFALSLLIYYGQYIPGMIARTLPYVNRTIVGGQENPGQTSLEPFWTYVMSYGSRLGYGGYPVRYGLALPLLLGLPGLWLLRRRRLAVLTIGAWYIVALCFFAIGHRVSMVDKQLFYVAPALAICAAAVLERAAPRNRLLQAAIVSAYVLTFLSALDLWILRLQLTGQ